MRRLAVALTALVPVALAGCSGGTSGSSSPSSPSSPVRTTAATASATTPSASAASSAGTPASSGTAAATVPTTGPAFAAALSAAAEQPYTVRTTVTGDNPMTLTGRGSLVSKTLAAHREGDAETAQDVEVVGGKTYASLPGFTTGRQRVVVALADPSDQLAPTVEPLVATTDLARVVAAARAATSVRSAGRTVTLEVPGRSVVALFGSQVTGALPASAPVVLTLDGSGRPARLTAHLGTASRTSTYGGWGTGAPVAAPPAKDVVDSPL